MSLLSRARNSQALPGKNQKQNTKKHEDINSKDMCAPTSTVVLSTQVTIWKQSIYSTTDKVVAHILNEIVHSCKERGNSCSLLQMKQESNIRKISQREDKYQMISTICGKNRTTGKSISSDDKLMALDYKPEITKQ